MLNVGSIGLGKMGRLHFLNALHMKDVKVVAAADKSKANLRIAKQYNVNVYSDFKKLFELKNAPQLVNTTR